MLNISYIDAVFVASMLILISFTAGAIFTLFLTSRGMERKIAQQKTFGIFFVILWSSLTTYVVFTQGEPLNWLFNASGTIAVGYVLGIDIGEKIANFRK